LTSCSRTSRKARRCSSVAITTSYAGSPRVGRSQSSCWSCCGPRPRLTRPVTSRWSEDADQSADPMSGVLERASKQVRLADQLVHLGRETTGAEMWYPPVAPSAVRSPREPVRPRPLTDEEVDGVVAGFRASASNAAQAGFQVVELHAAHGYLLAQFLSPATNL